MEKRSKETMVLGKIFLLIPMVCVLLLSGCATKRSQTGTEDKNAQSVVKAPQPAPVLENTSRLVLKSAGMPMNVDYSVGTVDEACGDLKKVGTVRDKGEGVLLPWIAKLTEKLNRVPGELETIVPAHKPIQISGYGNWSDGQSQGNCGPVVATFLPADRHIYLVEFVWRGSSQCYSRVLDVTDPVEQKTVEAQFKTCPRSYLGVLLRR